MSVSLRAVLVTDELSRRLNGVIEERVAPMLRGLQQSTRVFLESPMGAKVRADLTREGLTIDDAVNRESDMQLHEGHSGLRCFAVEGLRPQIDHAIGYHRLSAFKRLLAPWFEHGRFGDLTKPTRELVKWVGARPMFPPTTLYREQAGRLNAHPGQNFTIEDPESWSAVEKAVMGETTLIVEAHRGTAVSFLSPYVGEEEFIHWSPTGYTVLSVEDRTFGKQMTRRVVHLKEVE